MILTSNTSIKYYNVGDISTCQFSFFRQAIANDRRCDNIYVLCYANTSV